MWLKVAILILFIALVISLFSSLVFVIKDRGAKKRAWNALTVRIVLASLLIGILFYGIYTGQLGSNAPWDARYAEKLTPSTPKP